MSCGTRPAGRARPGTATVPQLRRRRGTGRRAASRGRGHREARHRRVASRYRLGEKPTRGIRRQSGSSRPGRWPPPSQATADDNLARTLVPGRGACEGACGSWRKATAVMPDQVQVPSPASRCGDLPAQAAWSVLPYSGNIRGGSRHFHEPQHGGLYRRQPQLGSPPSRGSADQDEYLQAFQGEAGGGGQVRDQDRNPVPQFPVERGTHVHRVFHVDLGRERDHTDAAGPGRFSILHAVQSNSASIPGGAPWHAKARGPRDELKRYPAPATARFGSASAPPAAVSTRLPAARGRRRRAGPGWPALGRARQGCQLPPE